MRYPTYHCAMCSMKHEGNEFRHNGKLLRIPRRNADIYDEYEEIILNFAMELIQEPEYGAARGLGTDAERMLHYQTLYTEHLYRASGFKTLYVEPGVLEMIAGARFDTDFEQAVKTARNIATAFSIAYPADTYVGNVPLRPTLVTTHTPREYLDRAYHDLSVLLGEHGSQRVPLDFATADGTWDTLDAPLLSTVIRHSEGHLITRSGNQKVYDEIIQGHHESELAGSVAMSPADEHVCNQHLNMAQRVLAYLLAFPDSLRDGYPRAMRDATGSIAARVAATVKPKNVSSISLPPRFRETPSPHFRHGHFRTLRAERYKRNVDGSCRVIYVNDMLVGKKGTNAQTVEEVKDNVEV